MNLGTIIVLSSRNLPFLCKNSPIFTPFFYLMKRKILILYTGGTIGMEKNHTTGSLQPFDFQNLRNKIPELDLLDSTLDVYSFESPLDSSDVGPKEWREIAEIIEQHCEDYDSFLILHGTDTMSYTSSALSFMLQGLGKPVILTGSQLPIGDLRTDAKENLLTGLYFAGLYEGDEPVIQEVALYFEYKLFRANRTVKFSAENFDAYISPNYPLLAESGVRLKVNKELLLRPKKTRPFRADLHLSNSVLLLRAFPGMQWDILKHLKGVKVLILEVFGSGTFPGDPVIYQQLQSFKENGGEIIITTQCLSGAVEFGKYENSNIFTKLGAVSAGNMTTTASLAKTMHTLDNPRYSGKSLQTIFQTALCGECDFDY